MYGGVGSGKTMLMDLFFDTCELSTKRRLHYNAFMLDIHQQLHAIKMKSPFPVSELASSYKTRWNLLCLDEFQVLDVADAMILRSLLQEMLKAGIFFVITSNRAPRELYLNGIQRQSFLPCIDLIESAFKVINLNSDKDHRRASGHSENASELTQVYFHPCNEATKSLMNDLFERLSEASPIYSRQIETSFGRSVTVPKCHENAAWFTFDQMMKDAHMSAADFMSLAATFPTLFLSDIPKFNLERDRDLVRRFITLVDIFYDQKGRLVLQADADLENLFSAPRTSVFDEGFAIQRTISRLRQMQQLSWWLQTDRAKFQT